MKLTTDVMRLKSGSLRKWFLMSLMMGGVVFGISCKSGKKVTETPSEPPQSNHQNDPYALVKDKLQALLVNEDGLSLEEREQALAEIVDMNITDPEVVDLIAKVEATLQTERDRLAAEQIPDVIPEPRTQILEAAFGKITSASSLEEADEGIGEALGLFASPDVPVLIVIYQSGEEKDYDRPTTIKRSLEYLKDHKEDKYEVLSLQTNEAGLITELELKRK